MKTLLAILLTPILAGWLALVVSLTEPPRVYVWTVEPATAPPSEVVEKGSERPAGCLVVWLF
jgi:hypothetical protein